MSELPRILGTVERALLSPAERQKAGLRPPWKPGQSGNPNGPRAAHSIAIRDDVETELARKTTGGLTWSQRIARRWVRDAAKGNGYARQQILERYFPVPKDASDADKRVILQSLTLDLNGARSPVFSVRHGPALSTGEEQGSEKTLDVPASPPSEAVSIPPGESGE